MNGYQIALLICAYVIFSLIVVLLNRGASERFDRQIRVTERRKKAIRWPVAH